MPRFVVLEHDHPFLHWDLMLEHGEILRTWRLPAAPETGLTLPATALGAHRRAYLDYEGPVSGGRGRVVRWDRGTYEILVEDAGRIEAQLHGERLRGHMELRQHAGTAWRLAVSAATTPDY